MRVVIAPDSFKESATAVQAANAIARGLRRVWQTAEFVLAPMADGGEGTTEALVVATNGRYVDLEVTGPIGDPVNARYGLIQNETTAVIEMAAAAGLALVPVERRDPALTTTYGLGQLISDVMRRGVREIILGLGGSATNDAGAGMAQALGYSLCDESGTELSYGGLALARLDRIDSSRALPELAETRVLAACDVDNPLCGPEGASFIYGPQKAASPELCAALDHALERFAEIVRRDIGKDVRDVRGAGAAGGLGAGLVAFTNATLRPGSELVADTLRIEEKVRRSDLVITGEGKLDMQSFRGKAPIGIARIAQRHGIPVVAICGAVEAKRDDLTETGIRSAFALHDDTRSLTETMNDTETLLEETAAEIARRWPNV